MMDHVHPISGGEDFDSFLDRALDEQLTLSELADRYTERVLNSTHGNKARAAQILGINRRTLYRRGFGGAETRETENRAY